MRPAARRGRAHRMRRAALWPQEESMRAGRHGGVGTRHGYQAEGLPRRSGAGPYVDLAATGHPGATGRRTSNAARALRACRARRTTSKAYGLTDRRMVPWRWRVVGKADAPSSAAAAWRPWPPRLARAWPSDWESWRYACCRALVRVGGCDMRLQSGTYISSLFTTPARGTALQ